MGGFPWRHEAGAAKDSHTPVGSIALGMRAEVPPRSTIDRLQPRSGANLNSRGRAKRGHGISRGAEAALAAKQGTRRSHRTPNRAHALLDHAYSSWRRSAAGSVGLLFAFLVMIGAHAAEPFAR